MLVHDYYQRGGGEDEVFRSEAELLRSAGHKVLEYVRDNDEIRDYNTWDKATLGPRTVWAWDSTRELRDLLKRERPDVAHFHNTFPLISPAAYYTCKEAGVPVVQTLHNYRLYCPAATFLREGHICEECATHSLLRSIRYGCYRDSRLATTAAAAMLEFHRVRQTWTKQVDAYVCLTEFQCNKLVGSGLPAERVFVKPNFVSPDPDISAPSPQRGAAVFVGRLSGEKGLITLLKAWENVNRDARLRIIGDGPLRTQIEHQKNDRSLGNVCLEGHRPRLDVLHALTSARFLVFPSEWYECFPVTMAEAFACGAPVICSRLGAMTEIVNDGRTGLHFTAGDADDLAAKVEWAWTHPDEMEAMGRNARAEYEAKYTAARNYQMIMDIYGGVIAGQQSDQSSSKPLDTRPLEIG
jgi:glycosyltransferase involved in cell wall biosynthesis